MKILVADEKCTHCSGTGFYSSPETNGTYVFVPEGSRHLCRCVHAVDLSMVRAAIRLLDEGIANVEVVDEYR